MGIKPVLKRAPDLVLLSALLQVLSYPPFDLGWLAWVAYLPWLAALQRASSPGLAFARSYLVGLLFFAGTIGWVGHVTVIGAILLVAYLALFFGAWGWLANRVIARPVRPKQSDAKRHREAPQGPWRSLEIASSSAKDRWRTPRNDVLWILPAAWVLIEYLRSTLLSGFGWNLLAHTQWNWIPVIQIADLTGVWGVSFLVMLVNVAIYLAFSVQRIAYRKAQSRKFLPKRYPPSAICHLLSIRYPLSAIVLAGLCLLAALTYGHFRLHPMDRSTVQSPSYPVTQSSNSSVSSFKVALVQGNILQSEKWDEAFAEAIWKRYEELTAQAARTQPDLIVWPETALPGLLEEMEIRARLDSVARSAGCPLLAGVATQKRATGRMHNSAVLLDPQGEELKRYDKIHLVPFGEFIPFRPILGWVQTMVPIGDFAPGDRFTVFPSPPTPSRGNENSLKGGGRKEGGEGQGEGGFSVLICFEDLFPELARRFVREGAQGLFVITNDAWFKQSAASLQHLQASVFRAVENRVWVARAANTGWTGVVDPYGRQLPPPGQAERFKPAVATARLPVLGTRTSSCPHSPYVRWGDWFPAGCLILTAMAFFPRRRPL